LIQTGWNTILGVIKLETFFGIIFRSSLTFFVMVKSDLAAAFEMSEVGTFAELGIGYKHSPTSDRVIFLLVLGV
jgi:hypothetical protein